MHIKASGRSALIIAFGLSFGLCGLPPAQGIAAPAAETATNEAPTATKAAPKKTVKPRPVQAKKNAKPTKPVTPIVQAPGDPRSEGTEPKPLADASGELPPSVANAYAQLAPAEAAKAAPPASAAPLAAEPAAAATPPGAQPAGAEHGLVDSEEVNDLDRAVAEAPQSPAADPSKMTTAQAQQPPTGTQTQAAPAAEAQVTSAAQNDGAWDKASLIGKIFIAAGGLLTLASAARMFIA